MLTRQFYSYVLPSLFAFALSGMYAIVDGIFVGRNIGDIGLSAINIAYPVTALLLALGTGIGMGGAVRYSIYSAAGKESAARDYLATAFNLLLLCSVVCTLLVWVFLEPILAVLGSTGSITPHAYDYLIVIAMGAVFQVFGVGFLPILRNFGYATMAMNAMVLGFLINILLDYLFISLFKWGTLGAALATTLGQASAFLLAIIYLALKRKLYLGFNLVKQIPMVKPIILIGLAPFGLTISPSLILMIINRACVQYGGATAVATYACIAYVICVVYLIMQAVGEGAQPLLSHFFGRNKLKALRYTRYLAYKNALLYSAVGMIVLYPLRSYFGPFFGASDDVGLEVVAVLPIFLLGLPCIAITRVTTDSFYATESNGLSYILTYAEPVLLLVLLQILPSVMGMGLMGVWWSVLISQMIAAAVALVLKYRYDQSIFNSMMGRLKVKS